jgi:beta-lactamase class D
MLPTAALLLICLVSSCAPAPRPAKVTSSPSPLHAVHAAADAPRAPANPTQLPRERPEWVEHFRAERVTGTIALYDSADASLSCSDVALCGKATIPASTFKIANSMIALETGVVAETESVLPWDGKRYAVEDWNHDQTLRVAVRVSCAPCFQAIARQVGDARMRKWLTELDYGNHDMSGGIDQFWLTGGLRISPLQQIDFLRRFAQGQLPISKRTAESVEDMITLDIGQNHLLLGKTGLSQPPEFPEVAAWFVGWVEVGERRVYFATLITAYDQGIDVKPARRKVTERVLRALGILPANATPVTF